MTQETRVVLSQRGEKPPRISIYTLGGSPEQAAHKELTPALALSIARDLLTIVYQETP